MCRFLEGGGGGEIISGVNWHTESYNRQTSSSHGRKVATGRMEITVRVVMLGTSLSLAILGDQNIDKLKIPKNYLLRFTVRKMKMS